MTRPLLASVLAASTLACVACAALAPLAPRAQAASGPQPTLFGQGPELYVSPTWGAVGQRITVVGLGYQPGRAFVISASSYDPYAGGRLSYWAQSVRAQSVVRPDGTLRVSFVIPRSYARLLRQQSMAPLDVRAHYGRTTAAGAAPAVGSHAIFMLMSAVYAPGPRWDR